MKKPCFGLWIVLLIAVLMALPAQAEDWWTNTAHLYHPAVGDTAEDALSTDSIVTFSYQLGRLPAGYFYRDDCQAAIRLKLECLDDEDSSGTQALRNLQWFMSDNDSSEGWFSQRRTFFWDSTKGSPTIGTYPIVEKLDSIADLDTNTWVWLWLEPQKESLYDTAKAGRLRYEPYPTTGNLWVEMDFVDYTNGDSIKISVEKRVIQWDE